MNAVTTNKKHIVLDDGFKTVVNISEYGDMELLEDLVDLDSDIPQVAATAMVRIFKKLLPADEKKRLWDHLRDSSGAVPVNKATEVLQEIFEKMQGADVEDKKKSSSSQE